MRLTHWLNVFRGAQIRHRAVSRPQGRPGLARRRTGAVCADIEPLEKRTLLTAPNPVNLGTLDAGNVAVPDGFRVEGGVINDKVGNSLSGIGDVNGDGFEDFVVGAPTTSQTGRAFVVFGKSGGFASATALDTLDGTTGFRLNGVGLTDQAGEAVTGIGDFNGDGMADFAIGAYRAKSNSGSVWVVFGKPSFSSSIDLNSLDGSDGFRLDGSANQAAGYDLGAAGDVNGDGFADLIIGAPTPNVTPYSGSAFVVFGDDGPFGSALSLSTLDGTNGFALNGDSSGYVGESVAGAGDFNGDGFDDVIIGEPYYYGHSFIVFGKSGGFSAAIDIDTINKPDGFRIDGEYIGRSVSSAGDVNGDGFDDVIVGADYTNYNGTGYADGEAYVVFGRPTDMLPASIVASSLDGTNGFIIPGASDGDQLGAAVSGAGDINGDGLGDLVIGVGRAVYDPNNFNGSGRSYVIFGSTSAFPSRINLRVPDDPDPDPTAFLDGVNGFRVDGATAGDFSGGAVGSAGDINGDGFDDILIGATEVTAGGFDNAGAGYVLLGGAFNAGAETQIGTDSGADKSDTLNASQGAAAIDRLIGGQGNDVLNADGGADVLIGGEGDDVLGIASGNVAAAFQFDGGTGSDTLKLGGASAFVGDLDLTAIADNRITDIEQIDLRGEGTNTLTLDVDEVLNISGTSNQLTVRRDAADTINFGAGWTDAGRTIVDGVTYQLLTQGEARLLLEALVSVSVTPASVGEGSGTNLVYTFSRTDNSGNVTVNFSVAGSAIVAADYTASGASTFSGGTGTVIIADGDTSATVTLTVINDEVVEGDEDVTLTVTSAAGYNVDSPAAATGTINDNDTAVLRFDTGASTPTEDSGTQNVAVRLIVTANGVAESGTIASDVQVNVANLMTGSATGADFSFGSPATLTFVGGSASGTMNAGIGLINDTVVESDESINLRLDTLSDSLGGRVSIDTNNDDHTVTIDDNDTAALAFNATSSNPSEADGTQDVTVDLVITANGVENTGTLGSSISVDVDRTGGTAAAGSDFTFTDPTTLTFGTGASSSSMDATISLTNDTVVELDETIALVLTGLSSTLDGNVSINASADDHTVTIDENDTAVFAFDTATSNPSEAVGNHNVAVSLTVTANGQIGTGTLSTSLSVDVANLGTGSATGADFTFTSPTQLSFSAGSETKNAVIAVNDDGIEESGETIVLELNSLADTLGGNVEIAPSGNSHTVTIADNDSLAPVTLQTELRIAHVATATDGNGEAATLPTNATFLDEWDEFFLEVWGKVANSAVGVDTAHIEIPYQSNFYSVDSVDFGASFAGSSTSGVDTTPGAGRITLDLDTSRSDAGLNNFVLFARIPMTVDVELANTTMGEYFDPTIDDRFDAENITATIDGGMGATPLDVTNLMTEIWPVMYDLDDNGTIGFGDLPAFAAVFGSNTGSSAAAFRADFDHGGAVSFGDVTLFANNLGRIKSDTGEQSYDSDFPTIWRNTLLAASDLQSSPLDESSVLNGQNDALSTLKAAAISQFEAAGLQPDDAETLSTVEIVVRDLPGRQLGVTYGNQIIVDIDAAGAGWFVDSTPESDSEFQSGASNPEVNGRYDLLTVVAHELGHVLGLSHGNDGELMHDTLTTDVRRQATNADLDEFYTGFGGLDEEL